MIALAFLWHQHQPYYPDDVTGENPMPWVRLHGVKDYYGMALHLDEFPEMRCTINLVPSLLLQLEGYTKRGATDQFLLAFQGNGGAVRSYTSVKEIHAEEGNARVWGGMHWRHSTEVGTRLGGRVGRYTARHLLKRLDD